MRSILFIADARSIHSHKWINYISKKSNLKVTWVSLKKSNYKFEKNINFINIEKNFLANCFKVFKVLFFSKPNLVHLHYVGYHSLFLIFLRNKSKLIINTWGSDIALKKRDFLKILWLKYLIQKSHLVLSDAYHHFDYLKNFGLRENKFKYLPYGTDIEIFSSNKNCFSSNNYTVIHTRGLDEIYDVKTFLKAAKLVIDKDNKFFFKVIGTGPKQNELQEYSRILKINDKVSFVGQLSQVDLKNEINKSDIYVSCALEDGGIAGSTSEAMACQRLVIITNNSDNHLWINNEINGYLFNNGDYKKLSELIINSLKDIPKSIKIANKAREKIVELNSYDKQMDKVLKLYDSILQNKK